MTKAPINHRVVTLADEMSFAALPEATQQAVRRFLTPPPSRPSLADEIAFMDLPEETQSLARRVVRGWR